MKLAWVAYLTYPRRIYYSLSNFLVNFGFCQVESVWVGIFYSYFITHYVIIIIIFIINTLLEIWKFTYYLQSNLYQFLKQQQQQTNKKQLQQHQKNKKWIKQNKTKKIMFNKDWSDIIAL